MTSKQLYPEREMRNRHSEKNPSLGIIGGRRMVTGILGKYNSYFSSSSSHFEFFGLVFV
jgi:hypothetical protein